MVKGTGVQVRVHGRHRLAPFRWRGTVLLFAAGLLFGANFSGCTSTCEDGGRTYGDGESWTCSDGCNGCFCNDGVITSTAMACPAAGPSDAQLDGSGGTPADGSGGATTESD